MPLLWALIPVLPGPEHGTRASEPGHGAGDTETVSRCQAERALVMCE